jgi:hypothetical protein
MVKELYHEDMTKHIIIYLANKILEDHVDSIDNLAIVPNVKNEKKLDTMLLARDIMKNYIKKKTNKSIEKFHLNLEGYFDDLTYGEHEFPHNKTLEKNYIILTDNFNDSLVVRHAHYFISKFGVAHKQIKIGTIVYANESFNHMNIISTEFKQHKENLVFGFYDKKLNIKPDYVGLDNQYEEFNGYNPEEFKLIKKDKKLFLGL